MFDRKQPAPEGSRTLIPSRPLAAALAGVVLAVGGISAAAVWAQDKSGPAPREARPPETIVLDLPAGESCTLEARVLGAKADAGEFFTTEPAIIRWGNGYRLSVRNAKVTLVSAPKRADGREGAHRILIEPRPGDPSDH